MTHRPGAHDDIAAAVAGLVNMLAMAAGDYYTDADAPIVWYSARGK